MAVINFESEEEKDKKPNPLVPNEPPAPPTPPNTPPEPPKKEDGDGDAGEADIFEELAKFVGAFPDKEVKFEQSPKGIADYVLANRELAKKEAVEEISNLNPNLRAAILHAANGGDPADIFKPIAELPFKELPKDLESKTKVIEYSLKEKGIDADTIKLIVANHIDKNTLDDASKKAYEALRGEADAKASKALADRKALLEVQANKDRDFVEGVKRLASAGKLGEFAIPAPDADKFTKFIVEKVGYDGQGGYQINLPYDEKALQALYFLFRNGDLSKFIESKANDKMIKSLFNKESKGGEPKPPKTNGLFDWK